MTTRHGSTRAKSGKRPSGRQEDRNAAVTADPFLTFPQIGRQQRCILEPGTRLDRFIVRKQLGSGGLGDVYLALDTLRDMNVAIKVAQLAVGDSLAAAHMHREVQVSDAVRDHRHVIKHFDLHRFPWGGTTLIVLSMEFADGGDLASWLQTHRGDLPYRRRHAMESFRQICLGVLAIHEAGLVHLDIKPSNVLLVNNALKVSDFGIASSSRYLDPGSPDLPVAGTPAFMMPRQGPTGTGQGARPDDIYGLGILYYMMCSRSAGPPGAAELSMLQAAGAGDTLGELEGLPRMDVVILRRCLAPGSSEGYPSVRQLLLDVQRCLERDPAAELRRAEGEAMWQAACRFFQQSRFDQACAACDRVLVIRPDHTEAAAMRKSIVAQRDRALAIYAALDDETETLDLDTQVLLLEQAIKACPDHPRNVVVQAKVAGKAKRYRQAMEEGMSAIRQADWVAVGHWFGLARGLNPGSRAVEGVNCAVRQVLSRLRQYRILIQQAIAAGDSQKAMRLARNMDEYQQRMSRSFLSQGGPRHE